ncbi:NADP-dependent oxidoreductase domain superfamily protein [Abortiporus biennis]
MSPIPLLYGTGLFYPKLAQDLLDCMIKHGHVGIDSARMYGNGTAETLIGQLNIGSARVDTKVFPLAPGDLEPQKLIASFEKSRTELGPNVKIRVFYLHAPDRATPFADQLKAVNDLYKQGLFEEFGLSNFMAYEVAEVVGICERYGYVKPTVYEGIYNLLDRTNEAELFPALRKYGIKFCAYSVLAGGFLTGKHLPGSDPSNLVGSHFDPNWSWSSFFTSRYSPTTAAVVELKAVCDKHQLKLSEVAYRWLLHHSKMVPGDHGIILGAKRVEQLETSLNDCEKGPLPQEVVEACEETWKNVKGLAHPYWL